MQEAVYRLSFRKKILIHYLINCVSIFERFSNLISIYFHIFFSKYLSFFIILYFIFLIEILNYWIIANIKMNESKSICKIKIEAPNNLYFRKFYMTFSTKNEPCSNPLNKQTIQHTIIKCI